MLLYGTLDVLDTWMNVILVLTVIFVENASGSFILLFLMFSSFSRWLSNVPVELESFIAWCLKERSNRSQKNDQNTQLFVHSAFFYDFQTEKNDDSIKALMISVGETMSTSKGTCSDWQLKFIASFLNEFFLSYYSVKFYQIFRLFGGSHFLSSHHKQTNPSQITIF